MRETTGTAGVSRRHYNAYDGENSDSHKHEHDHTSRSKSKSDDPGPAKYHHNHETEIAKDDTDVVDAMAPLPSSQSFPLFGLDEVDK